MDANKKQLLQKHQQDIIDDLEVNYIYDQLFEKRVISGDEFEHIRNLVSIVLIFIRDENFVPLNTKITQTDEYEIQHRYGLYGEGVRKANSFTQFN